MADGKPHIQIVTHEDSIEHPGSFTVLDIFQRDIPVAAPIRDDAQRKLVRRAIMRDFGRYLDMMLEGDAEQITVSRSAA